MRFSNHQQFPPSDAGQERARRRAAFLGQVKASIREAANAQGYTVTTLAAALGCHKSVVSRALDPASNVELLTLFDFAEVLGKEWTAALMDRSLDLGMALPSLCAGQEHAQTSWSPPGHAACVAPPAAMRVVSRPAQYTPDYAPERVDVQ